MTLAETRAALKPPLIFGNEEQIRAVRFIEKCEEAYETYQRCEHRDEHLAIRKGGDTCICIWNYPDDVVRETIVRVRGVPTKCESCEATVADEDSLCPECLCCSACCDCDEDAA